MELKQKTLDNKVLPISEFELRKIRDSLLLELLRGKPCKYCYWWGPQRCISPHGCDFLLINKSLYYNIHKDDLDKWFGDCFKWKEPKQSSTH